VAIWRAPQVARMANAVRASFLIFLLLDCQEADGLVEFINIGAAN
jgi:hypothetical protein